MVVWLFDGNVVVVKECSGDVYHTRAEKASNMARANEMKRTPAAVAGGWLVINSINLSASSSVGLQRPNGRFR